ncbi:MAG TPA: RecQ family ATP-dependent DNA helicase, partial [Methylomirabilota bacterium]|nr:RecQ family ATP-dependent DNA helicase [Methylomirabilota bacterium]
MSLPTSQTGPTRPRLEPLPIDRAMLLPAKLRWEIVARYRSQRAFAAAAELLDEIERQTGDSATLIDERARLAYAQEDYETAIELLTERVARQPSATSWIGLGRLYLEIGDLEQAREIAADLSQTSGGLMTVAAFLAEVERAAGDLASARGRYRRVIADKPEHVATLLALAGLELDEGDERAARHFADQAFVALGEGGAPAQLSAAAGVAEALGNLDRAGELRARALAAEAARIRYLEEEIAKALGDTGPDDEEPYWTPPSVVSQTARAAARIDPPVGRAAEPVRDRARSTTTEAEPEPETAAPDPEPDVDAMFPGTLDALVRLFGFDAFRPGQAAVIANVLARRDTLATMPTGAGKSLTFQLPAMLLDGVTLVMSPLIALMKDQVEGLPEAIRERTALVNSTLSPDELRRTLDELADGRFKLVYAAPERLRQHAFLRALRAAGVGLVVIDEAHCISLWGHDFRPDYLAIPRALPELGQPPVLAITATATPPMARAIGAGLGRDLDRVRASVFRPNLFYEAYRCANREEKVKRVVQICHEQRRKGEGCGIVYVSSRKDAEQIAGVLRDRGIGAVPYHAGLEAGVRSRNQETFMRGDPRSSVIVATVAFGMGVNKADIRFIIHLSPPRSLEAYAQESGRAGRDGKPARCALLFAPADQSSLKRFAKRDMLDLDDLRPVYAGLKRAAVGNWAILDPSALIPPPGPDDDPDDAVDPRVALGILEQAGLVFRHPDAPVARFLRPLPPAARQEQTLSSDDHERWTRFQTWAGVADSPRPLSVQTDAALAALDLTPNDLDRVLGAQTEYAVRDDRRAVCLELLPAGADAAANLRQVLERAKIEANRRIDQVMAYAAGRACRHATLAAHLGERLAPCRTAC